MRGITEDQLEPIIKKMGSSLWAAHGVRNLFRHHLEELNPWQPIETAPKDRRLLLLVKGFIGIGHWEITPEESYWMLEQAIVGDIVVDPTHWQELPEDPK